MWPAGSELRLRKQQAKERLKIMHGVKRNNKIDKEKKRNDTEALRRPKTYSTRRMVVFQQQLVVSIATFSARKEALYYIPRTHFFFFSSGHLLWDQFFFSRRNSPYGRYFDRAYYEGVSYDLMKDVYPLRTHIMYQVNFYVECTTELSFNHSFGRTLSWRICIFLQDCL